MSSRSSPRSLFLRIFAAFVALTLTFGLINLWSDAFGTATEWAVTTSVLVAAIVFLAQYLTDVERRLDKAEDSHQRDAERIERALQVGFTKVNEATELFGRLDASALATDTLAKLIQVSTTLDSSAPALVRRFAQAELDRVTDELKNLGQLGDLAYEGEDRDWLLSLTANTTDSIDSTSLTTVDANDSGNVDDGLWMSDLGQRYLEAQLEAVRRGVRIRRLFIIDRPELAADPYLRALFESHRSVGIDVRVLDPRLALPGRQGTALVDFVLFDGVLSYESTPATAALPPNRQAFVVNTRLVLQPARVKERVQRFADLWAAGKDLA